MALINNINTQNTFDQWVTTTQQLVSTVNFFTDGPSIIANTSLDISGTGSKMNVRNIGAINTLYANTANIANVGFTGSSMTVPGTLGVTRDVTVGGNTTITSNVSIGGNVAISQNVGISGNLVISYNMNVASNITVNNITAFGRANATNVTVSGAINTAFFEYTTANGQTLAVTGIATMNRAAGNVLSQIEEISIALSLVLG
jgi:hypothetical protein